MALLKSFLLPALLLCCACQTLLGGKVLLVDSYHEGYPWGDGVCRGAAKVLEGKAELKIFYLNNMRSLSEDERRASAAKAYAEIQAWKPDVAIISDDPAAKYLFATFLKDSPLPIVFCGVNWDASSYGLPGPNGTGMLEVSMVKPLRDTLRKFARGDRIGFLGSDGITTRKEAHWTERTLGSPLKCRFTDSFAEWKEAYLQLQSECDMLFLYTAMPIADWNPEEARRFVLANTSIPTGATLEFMAPFALVSYAKSPEEQGEWGANAALKILGGAKPSSIPVAQNKRIVLLLNLPLADHLSVKFPLELIRTSKIIR